MVSGKMGGWTMSKEASKRKVDVSNYDMSYQSIYQKMMSAFFLF